MDQASRIVAKWSGASDVIGPERIACGAWKIAVGPRLAERTRAVKLVRDRLVVRDVEDGCAGARVRKIQGCPAGAGRRSCEVGWRVKKAARAL